MVFFSGERRAVTPATFYLQYRTLRAAGTALCFLFLLADQKGQDSPIG
jgi:hypothetical protein